MYGGWYLQISVTDNGVSGDTRLFRDTTPVIIRITNVNDVTVTGFAGTTVLPTAGGGVTVINGANLGRIAPLEDGTWGPLAVVSFGGVSGTTHTTFKDSCFRMVMC
jgi:hypothetical protein